MLKRFCEKCGKEIPLKNFSNDDRHIYILPITNTSVQVFDKVFDVTDKKSIDLCYDCSEKLGKIIANWMN